MAEQMALDASKKLYYILIENSPIIIASIFTSLSFIYQNPTGIIYLFLLVVMCMVRNKIIDVSPDITCKGSSTNGSGFSAFVFSFTFGYVFLPMFILNDINLPLLISYIVYFLLDVGITINYCSTSLKIIGMDLLVGSILGFGICSIMWYVIPQLKSLLFFNEISSSKEMCTVKNKKAFKCTVAK